MIRKEKRRLFGEGIWFVLIELIFLNEVRFFFDRFFVRNVGFYKIYEMDILGYINMEMIKKKEIKF